MFWIWSHKLGIFFGGVASNRYRWGHANYRLSPEGIFVKTHLCAESRQVSHSRVQHHNHQMTKSKSTCSLGTSTVSASAQQNTAQWDKFVDFKVWIFWEGQKIWKNLCSTFDKSVVFCALNSILVKKSTKIFQTKCGQVILYKL